MDRAQGLAPADLALRTTPLCVDLDGTLVCGDTLVEGAIALLKRAPWLLLATLWWLLGGKARLKREIAARQPLDAARLPYRQDFLAWLRVQAGQRPLYLATAAHSSIADAVAAHLGLFAGVFATGDVNLSAKAKARALSAAFGEHGFDYAGNDHADLPVWSASGGIVVVGASARVARAAARLAPVLAQFDPAPAPWQRLLLWLRALRLYQWVKNLLVFVAPLAAHTLDDPDSLLRTLGALVSFGLAASAVYVFNDVVDLDADRAHPRKRLRAFAAGRLPVTQALLASPLLMAAGLGLALSLGKGFALVLLSYAALTTLYSLWLKQKLFLDVVALAGLYSVRVVGGAVASSLPLSSWLLSLCAYGFLSLALVKRFAELSAMRQERRTALSGRAYRVEDMPVVMALGCGAGLLASLVMALYVDSEAGRMRYAHPEFLWGLSPLIIVGLGRLWLVAGRGAMHDDPIVFVARDRVSLLLVAMAAILAWAAL
jgi:4-hydroxybenzoate polyprenyltransferase